MEEFANRYQPQKVEDKWRKYWEAHDIFHVNASSKKKPYTVMIPPPNITGILHMGHALNNTLQDIVVRYKRMKGFETLWMPGTDHAGIATQNVVEKQLSKEGKTRHDISREDFLQRLWDWKAQYGDTIIHQLKKLGASCDWKRLRFTMDDGYSQAVKTVFVELFKKNLIYRGQYIINWCPRCHTALSDEEVEHKNHKGHLYYIRYPFKNNLQKSITVATTRPETMLGDTAVAVNPHDNRYKKFIGQTLILPLLNREIPIIADVFVDQSFGTGAVKVTPAHDPNDFQMGKRHHLEFINIFEENGILNQNAKEFSGLDRFKGRETIVQKLKNFHLLDKVDDHIHSVGHCYRCSTIIEPYLSKQWFVRMQSLAKPAADVVEKNEVVFYPKRWSKAYLNWMENIRDWCISRQIWWGHRIPVWYCKACGEENPIVSLQEIKQCPQCKGENLYQDEDVLDTWFSSWLWPFATLGWPNVSKELHYFYPTSSLFTAPEIIFFWVARMIMSGLFFMNNIPFSNVYIHGTVRDAKGRKMSKSLGNAIDPLNVIDEYGADALRFSLIVNSGQDLFISKEKFEIGRNFTNKIWNAARLIFMNTKTIEGENLQKTFDDLEKNKFSLPEQWILSRLQSTIKNVEAAIEEYRFSQAEILLYDFIWKYFCDWYLEIIKPEFHKKQTQVITLYVLEKILRLIHPFLPFISEEIWEKIGIKEESLALQQWPSYQSDLLNFEAEKTLDYIIDLIGSIRNIRSQWNITQAQQISCIFESTDQIMLKMIKNHILIVKSLARLDTVMFEASAPTSKDVASGVVGRVKYHIPLHGIIDVDQEKRRISKQIDSLQSCYQNLKKRIQDKTFCEKAPEEIVKKEKNRLRDLESKIEDLVKIKKNLL